MMADESLVAAWQGVGAYIGNGNGFGHGLFANVLHHVLNEH